MGETDQKTITKAEIEGLMDTIRNLYLSDEIPWVVGYSGGKDSSATLQLVWLALSKLSEKQRFKPVHDPYRHSRRKPYR